MTQITKNQKRARRNATAKDRYLRGAAGSVLGERQRIADREVDGACAVDNRGEKTGLTCLELPADALQLLPADILLCLVLPHLQAQDLMSLSAVSKPLQALAVST